MRKSLLRRRLLVLGILVAGLTVVASVWACVTVVSATGSLDCHGVLTINVSGFTTGGAISSGTYNVTINGQAFSGTIPITTDSSGNFTATVTAGVGALTGSVSVAGTVTVADSGPMNIIFSPNTLNCSAPSLTVTKTADAATVTPGSLAGFTIRITNTGTVEDDDVTLSDPLPAGAGSDINWTIDTTTGNPSDFQITGATGSQVLTLVPSSFTLAAGASVTVHITGLTSVNDATTSGNTALNVGGVNGYTVLYEGTGGHNLQITNVSIGGNVGVGGTGHVQFNGPGTIGGRLDFSAPNTGQYSNNNHSNVGPTSVNYNVAAVTTALNAIGNLSTSLGGLPGTSITFNNASQTVNESSGELQTTGGITYRVFNVTSYSENDGDVVTINGDGSGDTVVFNFSFNSNVNLGGDVVLTGGLTPDQVIWNFTSSNQNIQLNNNASSFPFPTFAYRGVILAPNDKISVVNTSLIGRVLGGDSSDMQIVSGANIHTPPGIGTLVNTATVSAASVSAKSATATVSIN